MKIQYDAVLDVGLLFGLPASGESIKVQEGTEQIEVNGCVFRYGNVDRNRFDGYVVPRSFPTNDYYPHFIGSEGFWHPANPAAMAATQKE